jgi:hypothetical protein
VSGGCGHGPGAAAWRPPSLIDATHAVRVITVRLRSPSQLHNGTRMGRSVSESIGRLADEARRAWHLASREAWRATTFRGLPPAPGWRRRARMTQFEPY